MNSLRNALHTTKLLTGTLAVTLAGDWLLFDHGPGLGTALFFACLWAALQWNRPLGKRPWLFWGLFLASVVQCGIEPGFANSCVLFVLTAYVSAHWLHGDQLGKSSWRVLTEGLLGLVRLPLSVATIRSGVAATHQGLQTDGFKRGVSKAWTAVRVAWPVVLVALPFCVLFAGGNAVLRDGIGDFFVAFFDSTKELEPPSFGRLLFWLGLGAVTLGLLSKAPLTSWLGRFEERLPHRFREPSDKNVAAMRTWLLLVVVNVIFFSANTADAWFLWLNSSLPDGVTFSDFVHEGVYRLIACVLLAALVLCVLFHQVKEVIGARTIRALAFVWIGQNLFLVGSVLLRLRMYIDAYQLTLLRLYVVAFLALVAVGFLLLYVKIQKNHGFAWLLNSNCLAVFWLFFIIQFLNDRGLVARVNYKTALRPGQTQVIDVAYLADLGAPAWRTLDRIANDPIRFPFSSQRAADRLLTLRARELGKELSWQSWHWRQWRGRSVLIQRDGLASSR